MRLVEARPSHIPFLAQHMRGADVLECGAFGRTPRAALSSGLGSSLWALTAIVDDAPHAMMGVTSTSMIAGLGVPWMLGTERVYDHARDLARWTPIIIGEMHKTFPVLENLVWVGNDRAIRFIRRAGFEICDAPINVGGTAFVHFRREA